MMTQQVVGGQRISVVQTQSTPRRSDGSIRGLSPGASNQSTSPGVKPGQVQEAMSMVPTVHSQLTLMEDTIRALSEENQRLKERLLKNRRGQLEKFFMTSSSMLMQGVFGEWCRVYKALKAQRELDGLKSRSVMNRDDFERRALELQQRIKELADLLNQARQEVAQKQQNLARLQAQLDGMENENGALAAKAGQLEEELGISEQDLRRAQEEEAIRQEQLALAEQLIAQFMEMSGNYRYQTNPQKGGNVTVPQNQQTGYIKDALNKILADVYTGSSYAVGRPSISEVAIPQTRSFTGSTTAASDTAVAGTIAMEQPVTAIAMEQPVTNMTTMQTTPMTAPQPTMMVQPGAIGGMTIGLPNVAGMVQKRTLPTVGQPMGAVTNLMMSPRGR